MYAGIPKRVRNDALCLVVRHCENLQRKFVAIQKSTVLHVQGDSSVVALPLNDSLESHSEHAVRISLWQAWNPYKHSNRHCERLNGMQCIKCGNPEINYPQTLKTLRQLVGRMFCIQ